MTRFTRGELGRFYDRMMPPWPAAFDPKDREIGLRRARLALETVIARIRPGTFYYPLLTLGYVPLDGGNLAPAIAVLCIHTVLAVVRFTLYRRTIDARAVDPDRWRRIYARLSAVTMLTWDSFTAYEVVVHRLDATSMLLVAGSVVLRASGGYGGCPDLNFYRVWSRWTRVPVIVAPLLLLTPEGAVLSFLLVAHSLYGELQARQLNAEFWAAVVATDSLAAAHADLQHEVALRERVEVELRLAQKLESVGRLAGGIAHEINTPLQAMLGSLELLDSGIATLVDVSRACRDGRPIDADLVEEADYLAEQLPGSIELAKESLRRAATIVKSVQTFARPNEAGATEVDVNAALATTLTIAHHEYAAVADVTTDFGDIPVVRGFAGELNQAFLHIIVNAAQAMEPCPTRGRLTIVTRRDGDAVRIAISDTGVGISDDIKHRVFDPFFTTKEPGKGTGQGLAVAQSVIATHHGGSLGFESTGGNTTFTIRLPIAA